jgi:hypothetical protein
MCMMLNADNCIDEKLLLVDYKPDFDVAWICTIGFKNGSLTIIQTRKQCYFGHVSSTVKSQLEYFVEL